MNYRKRFKHCIGGCIPNYPQEEEMQKGKMVVTAISQIAVKRREVKTKEKRKDIPI